MRGETEKGNDTRWGRILTASLHIAGKSSDNVDSLLEDFSKIPLDVISKTPSRALGDIHNFINEISRVRVKVSVFQPNSLSLDSED